MHLSGSAPGRIRPLLPGVESCLAMPGSQPAEAARPARAAGRGRRPHLARPVPGADGPVTLEPGRLVVVGPAVISTGGAVANTGVALHRLGVRVRLVAQGRRDLFGAAVLEALAQHGGHSPAGIGSAPAEATSYTIVISPPGVDRSFLHCPGANQTFSADDVPYEQLAGARLFHFGYPPLMPRDVRGRRRAAAGDVRARARGGAGDVARPLRARSRERRRARRLGGGARRALPLVDVFAPSIDELLFMLDRPAHARLQAGAPLAAVVDRARLAELGGQLIEMGARSSRSSSASRACTCGPPPTPPGSARSASGSGSTPTRGAGARCSRRASRRGRSSARPARATRRSPGCSPRCCAARARRRGDERDRGRRLQRRGGRSDERDPAVAASRRAHRGRLARLPVEIELGADVAVERDGDRYADAD